MDYMIYVSDEVKAAAELSVEAALESSIEHWDKNASLTFSELVDMKRARLSAARAVACALCIRFAKIASVITKCGNCPLYLADDSCCSYGSSYKKASMGLEAFYACGTDEAFEHWQEAAANMRDVLIRLREELPESEVTQFPP